MHYLANPTRFFHYSRLALPWLFAAAVLLWAVGLYLALFASPPDYQQGESVRMMYVHVPAAWLAMGGYLAMAVASAMYLIWRHPLADLLARSTAPVGAAFTLICLVTGSLWGKPMWGAWWVWDARLTSVLVLMFLYIGYLALDSSTEGTEKGRKACAALALIGVVNLPVIHFSVEWWNTLHQPASVIRLDSPAIHTSMLWPLMVMAAAYLCLFLALVVMRTRTQLMRQKIQRFQLQASWE